MNASILILSLSRHYLVTSHLYHVSQHDVKQMLVLVPGHRRSRPRVTHIALLQLVVPAPERQARVVPQSAHRLERFLFAIGEPCGVVNRVRTARTRQSGQTSIHEIQEM
jgi:hypothetical protein